MRIKKSLVVSALLLIAIGGVAAEDTSVEKVVGGMPLTGQEAVEFLRVAKVVGEPENFDSVAITDPLRVRMTDGTQTLRAIFKDENTLYPNFRYGDGREVERAMDSYKHEIAAFELDLMLGLDLVPPCVERKMYSRKGSLCLWVEGSMTEAERREKGLEPPDVQRWKNDMLEARLFQQLIADLDFSNIRNLIVDEDFRIHKIDSSMAFYTDPRLIEELNADRFSRRFVKALELLDRGQMDEKLKPWLYKVQRKDLWARRDRILKRAEKLIAKHGEAEILY